MHIRCVAVWMWPQTPVPLRPQLLPSHNILQKAEVETLADAGCMEAIEARPTACTNLFIDLEVCFC